MFLGGRENEKVFLRRDNITMALFNQSDPSELRDNSKSNTGTEVELKVENHQSCFEPETFPVHALLLFSRTTTTAGRTVEATARAL